MKVLALLAAIVLILIILFGAIRAIHDRQPPFVRPLDETTRSAYALLTFVAILALAWSQLDLTHWHVESINFAGINARVNQIQKKVDTLSD